MLQMSRALYFHSALQPQKRFKRCKNGKRECFKIQVPLTTCACTADSCPPAVEALPTGSPEMSSPIWSKLNNLKKLHFPHIFAQNECLHTLKHFAWHCLPWPPVLSSSSTVAGGSIVDAWFWGPKDLGGSNRSSIFQDKLIFFANAMPLFWKKTR